MNDAIFWRIVWKEYRSLRSFWLIVTGFAIAIQFFVSLLIDRTDERATVVYLMALVLSSAYAAGCAGVLFAAEKEDGTFNFLRQLPLSAGRAMAGKLSFALLSTLLMLGVLLLSALAAARGETVSGSAKFWNVWALVPLELLAWGIFFSLLNSRVLNAVCLAVGMTFFAAFFRDLRPAVIPMVLFADVALAWRWLADKTFEWSHVWSPPNLETQPVPAEGRSRIVRLVGLSFLALGIVVYLVVFGELIRPRMDLYRDWVMLTYAGLFPLIVIGCWLFGRRDVLLRLAALIVLSSMLAVGVYHLRLADPAHVHFPPWFYSILPVLPLLYVIVLALLFLNARDWWRIYGPAVTADSQRSIFQRLTGRKRLADLAVTRTTLAPGQRMFVRLIWHEWRLARRFLCFYVPAAAVFMWTGPYLVPGIQNLMLPVTMLILGLWAFRDDARNRHSCFLAERGIAPSACWLSKQLVWMVLVPVILYVALALSHLAIEKFSSQLQRRTNFYALHDSLRSWLRYLDYEFNHALGFIDSGDQTGPAVLFLFTISIYAAGQLVSMLIARTVSAGFIALVLAAALTVWHWLMFRMQVPRIWSLTPIPLALLAATFLRTQGWTLGRHTLRSWMPTAAVLIVPTAALFVAVPYYRVQEIKFEGSEKEILQAAMEGFPTPITDEEKETALMYERAGGLIIRPERFPKTPVRAAKPDEDAEQRKSIRDGWQYATGRERNWVEGNREALELTLKAAARPSCVFVDPARRQYGDNQSFFRHGDWYDLHRLVRYSAAKLEAHGKLDQALEYHVATLRMLRHFATLGDWNSHWVRRYTNWVFRDINRWAGMPGQTPARLKAAIGRLDDLATQPPPLSEAVKVEYLTLRRALLDDSTDLTELRLNSSNWSMLIFDLLGRNCAWEKTRTIKLLDHITARQLFTTFDIERELKWRGSDLSRFYSNRALMLRNVPDTQGAFAKLKTTSTLHQTTMYVAAFPEWSRRHLLTQYHIRTESRRRCLQIALALAAWRLEHGELPGRLDQLVGPYFEQLPLDPWTGREYDYYPHGVELVDVSDPLLGGLPPDLESFRKPFLAAGNFQGLFLFQTGQTDDGKPGYRLNHEDYQRYLSRNVVPIPDPPGKDQH